MRPDFYIGLADVAFKEKYADHWNRFKDKGYRFKHGYRKNKTGNETI